MSKTEFIRGWAYTDRWHEVGFEHVPYWDTLDELQRECEAWLDPLEKHVLVLMKGKIDGVAVTAVKTQIRVTIQRENCEIRSVVAAVRAVGLD